jgi:hypothetical protein
MLLMPENVKNNQGTPNIQPGEGGDYVFDQGCGSTPTSHNHSVLGLPTLLL